MATEGLCPTGHSGLSGGAIAGIVIGALAAVAIVLALACLFFWRRAGHPRRSSSLPVYNNQKAPIKGSKDMAEEIDDLSALPQQNKDLQPGTNPFHLAPILSWKPDEGVVSPSETSTLPTITSSRLVSTLTLAANHLWI